MKTQSRSLRSVILIPAFIGVPTQARQDRTLPAVVRRIGPVPADEAHQSFALEFINTKEGCLSSEEKLWRTEDGGRSWTLIFDAGRDEKGLPNPILGFQFVNSRTGWVLTFSILHDLLFNTRLYRTANGGRTWRRVARRAADHF